MKKRSTTSRINISTSGGGVESADSPENGVTNPRLYIIMGIQNRSGNIIPRNPYFV